MTPLRIVFGVNAAILFLTYLTAYTFHYGGDAQFIALLAPFVISAINLCLGVLSLILMGVLKVAKSDSAPLADKFMQAFMISFGVLFAYAIPACIFGVQHL